MERDFLGIGGMQKTRGSCNDSAFLTSPVVQSPLPNTMCNLQQYLSFKAGQEDTFKIVSDQFSSSGFQSMPRMGSFGATQRPSSMLLSQKTFGIDGQGTHPFPFHVYPPSQGTALNVSGDATMFPSLPNNYFPITSGNYYAKGSASPTVPNSSATSLNQQQRFGGRSRGPAPAVGSMNPGFVSRNQARPVPATAQLTIFYGGAVNVYDNVPLEKVQTIMFLASNSSNMHPNTGNLINHAPLLSGNKFGEVESLKNKIQPLNKLASTSPRSGFSSPIAVTAQSTSGSCSSEDIKGQKTAAPSIPRSQNEPSKSIVQEQPVGSTLMSRAVPMARKASLARFLEKRKERVTSVAPYSTQNNSGCGKGIDMSDMVNFPGKPATSWERSLPSGGEHSWCQGTPKYTIDDKPPNTKLEI